MFGVCLECGGGEESSSGDRQERVGRAVSVSGCGAAAVAVCHIVLYSSFVCRGGMNVWTFAQGLGG